MTDGDARSPGSNRQGRATRHALIEAGWRRVDQLELVDLFAALRPGRVAERAGRSAGAFRHHFASIGELVDAMMDALVEGAQAVGAETLTESEEPGGPDLVSHVRRDATGVLDREHPLSPTEQRVGLVYSRVATDDAALDVARREMAGRIEGLRVAAELMMDRFGREPIPPRTIDEILAVSASTTFGMLLRRAADPSAVPDALMADCWMAETVAFTREVGSTASVTDVVVELRRRREDAPDQSGREPELTSVLELFGYEWEKGSLSEVANALGQSVEDVRSRYGTVRRVAAESFGGCLAEVRAASERHRDRDPQRALADVFVELARWAGSFPGAARALIEERSDARAAGVDFAAVPVDAIAADALRLAVSSSGGDSRSSVSDAEIELRASSAIDVVLVVASTRDRMAAVASARVALCVVDDLLTGA